MSSLEELDSAIVEHVNAENYQPVKPRIIAKQLGFDNPDDVVRIRRIIKRLVKEGQVAFGPKHLVFPLMGDAPPPRKSRGITGRFKRNNKGFGFVRPERHPQAGTAGEDIFIPASAASDAASGDRVRVRLSGKRGRMGLASGRVTDIVERRTNRFVGTYSETAEAGWVTVDGDQFAHDVYVGDPGAKGAQPGDKVVIEMARFPSHSRDGEAVIVERLGGSGEQGVDTLSIIYEFNLPGDFPSASLEEARRQADRFDEAISDDRRDLTAWPVITIDPVDARDFDDAISLTRLDNAHWQLGVHIADVSHFVEEKSPLDQEARERATSVYLPDQVIPMLPEIISNHLASLQPQRVRYAMTALIELTEDGSHVSTEVFKSAIESDRRFTYEEVDEFLADPVDWEQKLAPPVHTLLADMHSLAMTLRKRRFRRGALELAMPELKVKLDGDGRVTGAHLVENTESHQIIEEFMLLANESVAELMTEGGIKFLRRVHGNPDPRKLKQLTEFVRELGFQVESLESRFELQRLLKDAHGDPREHAVNYAVLRSMQRAVYSPEEEGHYALASENYCHFTSPIRRYPDLTVHRLLHAMTQDKAIVQDESQLFQLGDHCSEREQRATDAERELTRIKLLTFLADKVGTELNGVVTGVESFGLFIQGSELPAEGMVHISQLRDDHYRYDKPSHTISGFRSGNTFRLGDAVRVAVAKVDIEKRQLDFRIIEKLDGTRPKRKKTNKNRSKKGSPKKRRRK